MKQTITIFLVFFQPVFSIAQSIEQDSSVLQQVMTVKAFEQNCQLMLAPASIAIVSKQQLDRFNNTSILSSLNSHPGVRMEERSPGSYRLNIRGSSLRSPFGIRNVKVYYDDIPYTDPGGNTYLNQLGFYNIQSMEVIKGPGSSLYGAGTGGVLLLNTYQPDWHTGLNFDVSSGSFGQLNLNTNLRLGSETFQNNINYSQLSSDGYRDHSELNRKTFSWDVAANLSNKAKITTHFLWGDLYYQTPGALTLSEYINNPKAARPRVGPTPGSEESKAAIYQKLFLAGISFNQKFSEHWENTTSFYGAATQLLNPSIRNYGRANEPHTGGRSFFKYSKRISEQTRMSLVTGIEFQQGTSSVRIYSNMNGEPDTLQTDDEINNRVFFGFAQATLELSGGWLITGGASLNTQNISITRLSTEPVTEQVRKYNNEIAPRMAVVKQFFKTMAAYASIGSGFSPPTTGELLPSSGIISTGLDAEEGINYEAGVRGSFNRGRIYFDVTAFHFALQNTIVQRRDQSGGDYFVNAGSTDQKGVEAYLSWQVMNNPTKPVTNLKVWTSYTWNNFTYNEFKQVNSDFSDNDLPGVAPQVLTAGADIVTKPGLYLNVTYYYSDPIPLNDANTAYASSFNLMGAKLGWKKNLHPKVVMEIFCAADNIFNVQYSLGNDINAFGGRYYNAAPALNFSGGISLRFRFM